MTEERPFQTAEDIRAAINDACPLHNPRLSEIDWAAVGRAFDARRTLDAARERPSALGVERYGRECNLAGRIAVLESLVNETPKRRSDLPEYWLADARAEYARLTEPDAGEGTKRLTSTDQLEAEQRGLPIPFAPTPDTTEPDAGEGTERLPDRDSSPLIDPGLIATLDTTEATLRAAECNCGIVNLYRTIERARSAGFDHAQNCAALQQPAIQPECECGCGYPNSGPYVRRAAVQPKGGRE